MENTEKPASPDAPITKPRDNWWSRLIGYAKRKIDERAAKKQKEPPVDRAARITANATLWIAIFTFVSIAVSVGTFLILKSQLREMHEGGVDTHDLAVAAKSQAELARQQAVALQQAVVRIQIPEIVIMSPGVQPAVQSGLRNEGVATATKVSFQGMLAWKAEPRHATIGQPVPINIEIPAMLGGDKGGRGYIFTLPGLTQDTLKLTRQSTKTRTIEFNGKLTYINGFDQLMSEDICKDYFAREQSDTGFIDCDLYSAKVKWWSDYERESQQGGKQPN